MGVARRIRASDLGPSYVFELETLVGMDSFIDGYRNSFSQYSAFDKMKPIEGEQLIKQMFLKYIMDISLDFGSFCKNPITSSIHFIGHEKTTIDPSWWEMFYGMLRNNRTFEYMVIEYFKGTGKEFLYTKEVTEIFHNIVKVWIKLLNPNFVWGDNFPQIKKCEREDSRIRVWGYNYYSNKLVNLIGKNRFTELKNSTEDWTFEEFNNGYLMIGSLNPYSMAGRIKIKAMKILKLEEALKNIISKKQTLTDYDNREL